MADRPPIDGLGAELLDRYLAGECAEDEAALVRRHLMANPQAARVLDAWLRQLDAGAAAELAPAAATAWATLRGRMRAAGEGDVAAAASPSPAAAPVAP